MIRDNGRLAIRRVDTLVKEISEKAQELNNVQTSLVSARDEITNLAERKARLNRECEDMTQRINEANLSLITAETEYQKKQTQILTASSEIKRITKSLEDLQPTVRELENLQASLTLTRRETVLAIEHKSHVVRESVEAERKRGEAELTLFSLAKEHQNMRARIFDAENEIAQITQTQKELQAAVLELKGYASKHASARIEYNEAKVKLDETLMAQAELDMRNAKAKHEIEIANREMGQYKNYLTDFYGKVATYVKAARETLEYINSSLEGTTPLVFSQPPEPLTMENFTKYYDL